MTRPESPSNFNLMFCPWEPGVSRGETVGLFSGGSAIWRRRRNRRPRSLLLLSGFALRSFELTITRHGPHAKPIPTALFHIGRANGPNGQWPRVEFRTCQAAPRNCVGIQRIARYIIIISSNAQFVGKKGVITRVCRYRFVRTTHSIGVTYYSLMINYLSHFRTS